jgi:hypothetical protein
MFSVALLTDGVIGDLGGHLIVSLIRSVDSPATINLVFGTGCYRR